MVTNEDDYIIPSSKDVFNYSRQTLLCSNALERLSKICAEKIPVKSVIINSQLIDFVWKIAPLQTFVHFGSL